MVGDGGMNLKLCQGVLDEALRYQSVESSIHIGDVSELHSHASREDYSSTIQQRLCIAGIGREVATGCLKVPHYVRKMILGELAILTSISDSIKVSWSQLLAVVSSFKKDF